MRRGILYGMLACLLAAAASASPVLLVSLDGLRPGDVLEARKRGLKLPNLEAFVTHGAYATGVRDALPSLTYPNHTTLITGLWPAQHGIANNAEFDPLGRNMDGYYWYEVDIRGSTLWDAVHGKHGIVASISWPVSVGADSIDYNVPEYWRAQTGDDVKLLRALSTPGLVARLEHDTGLPLSAIFGAEPQNDTARTRYAQTLFDLARPNLMTVHLVSLDHVQHVDGPDTPEAHAVLEKLDADVGELFATARRDEPDVTVAVVSDHGFAPVAHEVNLGHAFVEAGLAGYDMEKRKVVSWDAIPWNAGGSAMIVLARPDDQALKDRVAALLAKLAADPSLGIARVIDKPAIEARGGSGKASFWVDFRIGYMAGSSFTGPLVAPAPLKGEHGYFPEDKEMRATFLIDGPAVAGLKKRNFGEIDMRDIAPTLAKILDAPLPGTMGKPLF
ncbi:MAG TPA: ectonucleotide pyrophosphatase/phosphodiesterase [Rhizomicrobium sp.]|nr:ectonucleotide pyrophosphatase/phosphodiesterase [Rhizomicrobium sp.]